MFIIVYLDVHVLVAFLFLYRPFTTLKLLIGYRPPVIIGNVNVAVIGRQQRRKKKSYHKSGNRNMFHVQLRFSCL